MARGIAHGWPSRTETAASLAAIRAEIEQTPLAQRLSVERVSANYWWGKLWQEWQEALPPAIIADDDLTDALIDIFEQHQFLRLVDLLPTVHEKGLSQELCDLTYAGLLHYYGLEN